MYKSGKIIEANHLIVKGRGVEQVQRLETALEQLHQFMDAKAERYLGKTDVATKQVFQISIAIVILIFLSEWLIFIVSRLIIHDMGVIIEMLNNSDKQTNAENQTEISQPDVNHQTKISQKIVDLIQIELNDSLQKLDKMEVKLQELQAKNQKLQEEKWKLQEEKSVIETLSIDDSGLEKEKSPQAPLYKKRGIHSFSSSVGN
ncbi:hypothetical protein BGP_1343 [Beggiatoa sp. PS]|nr:hypothetical protein BGP_1343 [Beggiatoa sp. PS]